MDTYINLEDDMKKTMEDKASNWGYTELTPLTEDDMKKTMEDKASNWGYTELTPLTEDEMIRLSKHLKNLEKMEKNYKPNEPLTDENKTPFSLDDKLFNTNFKPPFSLDDNPFNTNFKPPFSLDDKPFNTNTKINFEVSQKGGTVHPYDPNDLSRYFNTLIALKRPDNTIIIILHKHPQGDIIIGSDAFKIDVYMFTTRHRGGQILTVNPFVHLFNPTLQGIPQSAIHITDTLASTNGGTGQMLHYPYENFSGSDFLNDNIDPARGGKLSDYVFNNYRENQINIGLFNDMNVDVVLAVNHTPDDIQTMECITHTWDTLMNPWWYTLAYTGDQGHIQTWLGVDAVRNVNVRDLERLPNRPQRFCRRVPGQLNVTSFQGRNNLIDEMREKVRQYNEFIDTKGRLTGADPATRIVYNPVPSTSHLNDFSCRTTIRTNHVYRGMNRRYTQVTTPAFGLQAGIWYKVENCVHTSTSRAKANNFAGMGTSGPGGRIVYRIYPTPGCPYYAYDNASLRSLYQECEIVFKPGAYMMQRVAPRPMNGFNYPVEDVVLCYDPQIFNNIATIHGSRKWIGKKYVSLIQATTIHDISQSVNILNAQTGGKKTKNKKHTFKKRRKYGKKSFKRRKRLFR
jgi:hypothetical protein